MKKIIVIILLVSVLVGCGSVNKAIAHYKGYTEVEVDGVIYLQFPSGVTVKYNADGTICRKK
jgi:uncharacterized protein YceK